MAFIENLYFIFICQRVGHTDRGISRISLIAVRAFQRKRNLINARLIFCRPDTVPVKIHAAVQVVRKSVRTAELLDIVGIKASFILTQMGDTIYFSARSIDEINVQIIMERLGGGGHRTIAGAQLKGATIDEAREKLKDLITDMMEKGEI